jgi:hypothetical protein
MKELFKSINTHVDTTKLSCIELFGRTGEWHTMDYMDQVKSLDILELEEGYREILQLNCPRARIMIGDTMRIIQSPLIGTYDMIVIDAPDRMWGENDLQQVNCEHFEIPPLLKNLIHDTAIVIFNVVKDSHPDITKDRWLRRKEFYQGTDKYLIFYNNLFEKLGYNVNWFITKERNRWVDYFCFSLTKI